MTSNRDNNKEYNKRLYWKLFIPTIIEAFAVFMGLKYLHFLELIDAGDVEKYKLMATGLFGIYVGINAYRIHLDMVLPSIGLSVDDIDTLSAEVFPEETVKGKLAGMFKFGIMKNFDDENNE